MAVELLVVRHGETDWNRDRRIQGQRNPGLNALGRSQAEGLARRLADEAFDLALSSDLSRARQTAEILCAGRGLTIGLSKALRERGFGKLEGMTWKAAKERYPEVLASRVAQAQVDPSLAIEDHATTFRDRILRGLRKIPAKYPEARRVLVVTHGGVVKVLLAEAEGERKVFMVPNCALYRFELEAGALRLARERG